MKTIKRILVGLDHTKMDVNLINAAEFLEGNFPLEEIHFVHFNDHNLERQKIKEEMRFLEMEGGWGDIVFKPDEFEAEDSEVYIQKRFLGKEVKVQHLVLEGVPLDGLLKYAMEHDMDLIVSGRKFVSNGSGVVPKQLVRQAPCSVLLVPEDFEKTVGKILVPFDFSDRSKVCLDFSKSIASGEINTGLTVFHAFETPPVHRLVIRSFEDFGEMVRSRKKELFEKILVEKGLDQLKPTLHFVESRGVAHEQVHQEIQEEKPDWIIMGSRGRTKMNALLLGSVAERVVQEHSEHVLWIYKEKGETIDLLEQIFGSKSHREGHPFESRSMETG